MHLHRVMLGRCLLLVVFLGACRGSDTQCGARTRGDSVIRAPAISVATLVGDPGSYDGQTVHVTGEVSRVLDDRTFLLRGHGRLWAPSIVVVGAPAGLVNVRVTGTAHARVPASLARELGDRVEADVGNRPIVVASTVEKECAS
jgi:hypothetical protein